MGTIRSLMIERRRCPACPLTLVGNTLINAKELQKSMVEFGFSLEENRVDGGRERE